MKIVSHQIHTYYEYNGNFYKVSDRKDFRLNDVFIDGRDYGVKIIESEQDLLDTAYMAPECYVILEKITIQN
jgi:hypothetical protein